MSLRVLYVTATPLEAEALRRIPGVIITGEHFTIGSLVIELLVGGIGVMETAWNMVKWVSENDKPDIAINAGIAGSYQEVYPVGSVVMPVSDCFADAGIEDGDKFVPLHEAGLSGKDDYPYKNGSIVSENAFSEELKAIMNPVTAITVNTATGSEVTRRKLEERYKPAIETMEGAAFFYICAKEKIPFISIRAISNIVEQRDRSKWNIPLALDNLALKLEEVFDILNK